MDQKALIHKHLVQAIEKETELLKFGIVDQDLQQVILDLKQKYNALSVLGIGSV